MERKKMDTELAIPVQLKFIQNSCKLYDEGCQEEAIRVAVAISVLLENRSSKGLLRRVVDREIKLLSTVPETEKVNIEDIVTLECKNISECDEKIKSIKNKKKFLFVYIADIDNWFISTLDYQGNKIECLINELNDNLSEELKLQDGWKWFFPRWVLNNQKGQLSDENKGIIIEHLDFLLGYNTKYVSSSYTPMIYDELSVSPKPVLSNYKGKERFLLLDDWEREIIFCVTDERQKKFYLTRKDLIKSARDQDGGGHFDETLKDVNYVKSKYGQPLAVLDVENGKNINMENFHLIMLRQLGYEILNSSIEN